jgi:hypothetical protein
MIFTYFSDIVTLFDPPDLKGSFLTRHLPNKRETTSQGTRFASFLTTTPPQSKSLNNQIISLTNDLSYRLNDL